MFSSSTSFAGAGTATATSGDTSENKSKSSIFFWSVVISIIGLIATVWFLSGDCTTCVLKEIVEEEELEVWFVLLHKDNCFNGNCH